MSARAFVLAGTLLAAACRTGGEAADGAAPEEIPALVRALGDAEFQVREIARERLVALDEAAVPALEKGLKADDPEVRTQAQQILDEIRSFTAQLKRWGRKGIREDLLGERWFVGYEDGEPVAHLYCRLEREAAEGSASYGFRIAVLVEDGEPDIHEGSLAPDASPVVLRQAPGGEVLWRRPAEGKVGWDPSLAVWWLPFWEFSAERCVSEVVLPLAHIPLSPVRVWREPEDEAPVPGGAQRAESFRIDPVDPEMAEIQLRVWWNRDRRLLAIEWTGLRRTCYPISREAALKAGNGKEWWK